MNTPPAISDKVLALLPRLACDADGEVIATARMINRQLKQSGQDWHDIVYHLRSAPATDHVHNFRTWQDVTKWCAARARFLRPNEAHFVRDMENQLRFRSRPTKKQSEWLRAIFAYLKEANQ